MSDFDLLPPRRLDIKAATRGYTSTEVVEYAERYGTTMDGATPDHLLLRWQLCSGFAHGRAWANLIGGFHNLAKESAALKPRRQENSGTGALRVSLMIEISNEPISDTSAESVMTVRQLSSLPEAGTKIMTPATLARYGRLIFRHESEPVCSPSHRRCDHYHRGGAVD